MTFNIHCYRVGAVPKVGGVYLDGPCQEIQKYEPLAAWPVLFVFRFRV